MDASCRHISLFISSSQSLINTNSTVMSFLSLSSSLSLFFFLKKPTVNTQMNGMMRLACMCGSSKRTRIGHFYMTSLQLLRFYWDLWIDPSTALLACMSLPPSSLCQTMSAVLSIEAAAVALSSQLIMHGHGLSSSISSKHQ
jgi:hypothetical protein